MLAHLCKVCNQWPQNCTCSVKTEARMVLGEVCEHGSLKRQCLICEYEEQLKAADALAKAAKAILHGPKEKKLQGQICCRYQYCDDSHEIDINKALAAYEKVRGLK